MSRIISVINGKGGVGKTSIAANVAGLLAAAGYRVLVVDLDPQGNLGVDLGFLGAGLADDGASLMQASVSGSAPKPLSGVRANLDVVPGGPELHDLAAFLETRRLSRRGGPETMAAGLRQVAADYDVTIIDCPPGNAVLQEGALAATRYVLIPTKTDDASRAGLREVARRFTEARKGNPLLELLGVVIFGVKPGATRLLGLARDRLATDLGAEGVPNYDLLFNTTIRHVEGAAVDGRRRGQLAHELEQALGSQEPWYARLRNPGQGGTPLASSAVSLAGDYAALADEILSRIAAAEAEEAAEVKA